MIFFFFLSHTAVNSPRTFRLTLHCRPALDGQGWASWPHTELLLWSLRHNWAVGAIWAKKQAPMREIIHPCSVQPCSSARSRAPTLGGARLSCAHSLDVTLRHALFLSDCAAVHVNTQCCSAAGECESQLHDWRRATLLANEFQENEAERLERAETLYSLTDD